MRIARRFLAAAVALSLTTQVGAQSSMTRTDAGILGLSLTLSGTARDTLGLLVAAVALGGPAERAGIVQGNRVAELAGVSLRVDPADIGQRGIEDQMARRLARALQSIQSGEQTSIRIVTGTRERSVQVTVGTMGVANVVAGGANRDVTSFGATPTVNTILPQPVPSSGSGVQSLDNTSMTTALTLPAVTDGLEQQRVLLRKLVRSEDDEAKSDSLLRIEQDLRSIVRRLRELQPGGARMKDQKQSSATSAPAGAFGGIVPNIPNIPAATLPSVSTSPLTSSTPTSTSTTGVELPGIRFAPVAPDMVSVVGEGTEGGLFVFFADSTWSPVQSGDVVLRIDGQAADAARMRAALGSAEPAAFEVIRQRRRMIVTLHSR